MISQHARLSIQRIPIAQLQVKCYHEERYPERVLHYYEKLKAHPHDYAGLLSVVPSDTHSGMFCLLDGHHRYLASILAQREDALCVVIVEEEKGVA